MQEDIPDTQGGHPIEGQGSEEEITVDKDCPLGIEVPFDKELFKKTRKLRAHLTRAEKRRLKSAVDKTGWQHHHCPIKEKNRRKIRNSRGG